MGTAYIVEAERSEAVKTVRHAYDSGINYYDLAAGDGTAFAIFGEALSDVRDEVMYDGIKPVGQFIRSLDLKMKAKVVANMHLLEEYGNMAREPLSKELEDGIFELRTVEGNDIVRILYFFDKDRRSDYQRRKEAGTYE